MKPFNHLGIKSQPGIAGKRMPIGETQINLSGDLLVQDVEGGAEA